MVGLPCPPRLDACTPYVDAAGWVVALSFACFWLGALVWPGASVARMVQVMRSVWVEVVAVFLMNPVATVTVLC